MAREKGRIKTNHPFFNGKAGFHCHATVWITPHFAHLSVLTGLPPCFKFVNDAAVDRGIRIPELVAFLMNTLT